MQAFSSGALMFCSRIKKAHVETRKEGRKWWLQQYEHNKQLSPGQNTPALQATLTNMISHCPPTLSLSMLAGPENMEGRSPCRENNDSLPIQIPRCDTPFGQFKEEKLMQLGYVFSGEKQNFVYHKDFDRRRVT